MLTVYRRSGVGEDGVLDLEGLVDEVRADGLPTCFQGHVLDVLLLVAVEAFELLGGLRSLRGLWRPLGHQGGELLLEVAHELGELPVGVPGALDGVGELLDALLQGHYPVVTLGDGGGGVVRACGRHGWPPSLWLLLPTPCWGQAAQP